MTLISIVGDVGSGKTLLATFMALKDERPVYANYKIKLPNKRYKDLKPETLFGLNTECLVILDEAYNWLESRTSGRNINLYMSYILFQSRKRNMDIVLTDQLVGTIDVRFRLMTNFEIYCQNIADVGFEYTIFKKSTFVNFRPARWVMPYSIAETIYPKYDSWQLINPIDEELLFNITEDKTSTLDIVDTHADKLLAKFDGRRITKGIVDDYCLRSKLPENYVKLIFNAVKSKVVFNG